MRRFVTGLLVVISALALVLSSTSLWLRHNVINTTVFVSNVETVLDQPAVRNRISQQVATSVMTAPQVQNAITQGVDQLPPALQRFRPSVASGVESLIVTGVQSVLTAEPFRPLTSAALTSAHQQLVAGQPVRFTLGQAKRLVPQAAQSGLPGQVLALVPNDLGITLLTPAQAPQLYTAVDLLQDAWWWAGLIALLALAGALLATRRRRAAVIGWSATTAGIAALVLLALRIVPAAALPQVQSANRAAASAAVGVFTSSLRVWTLWVAGGALVVLAFTLLWGHLGLIPALRRAGAAARRSAEERRASREAERAEAAATGAPPPPEQEPWTRRTAESIRVWWAQLALPERFAGLGGFVGAHLVVVRWAGVAVGAVMLLLWPSPTIATLIWVAALVALYLAVVEWLQARAVHAAPEAEEAPAEVVVVDRRAVGPVEPDRPVAPEPERPAVTAPAARPAAPAEPAPQPAAPEAPAPQPAPVAAAIGGNGGNGGRRGEASTPPPEPLVPTGVTPEALSTLDKRLDLLVRLGDARRAGVLTEEEFDEEKEALLRR